MHTKKIIIGILLSFIIMPYHGYVFGQEIIVGDITLEWNDNSDNEDHFILEYSANSTGNWVALDTLASNTTEYGPISFVSDDTFHFRIYASNAQGNSEFSNLLDIIFQQPEETLTQPERPAGESSPIVFQSYTYTTTGATSSLGHTLEYQFNWGDGTTSTWTTSTSASNAWSAAGPYSVTVTARCQDHPEKSASSDPLNVNVQNISQLATPQIDSLTPIADNQLILSWVEIENATGYNIYRDNTINFTPSESNRIAAGITDQDPGTPGVQWNDTEATAGDFNENQFYVISAVDQSQESGFSELCGEFDFSLITTASTNFNEIALPLNVPGIVDAQTLMAYIPGCDAVAKWNQHTQGYDQ